VACHSVEGKCWHAYCCSINLDKTWIARPHCQRCAWYGGTAAAEGARGNVQVFSGTVVLADCELWTFSGKFWTLHA
jgi:hypothetical protein